MVKTVSMLLAEVWANCFESYWLTYSLMAGIRHCGFSSLTISSFSTPETLSYGFGRPRKTDLCASSPLGF